MPISEYLAVRDAEELVSSRAAVRKISTHEQKITTTSAQLTTTAMIQYFKPKMESVIDRGSKLSHEDFAG